MSRLNTLTTLVSAGYPAWYAYGVSRGIIDTTSGLREDLQQQQGSVAYGEGLSQEDKVYLYENN